MVHMGSVTSLASLLQKLDATGLSLKVKGFFNIESGVAAVQKLWFGPCDCMEGELGFPIKVCGDCGRSNDNFVSFPAGDGDGVYVAVEIVESSSTQDVVGYMTVFRSDFEIPNFVSSEIQDKRVPRYPDELLAEHETASIDFLCTFKDQKDLFLADASGFGDSIAAIDLASLSNEVDVFAITENVSDTSEQWLEGFASRTGGDMDSANRALARAQAGGQVLSELKGVPSPGLPNKFYAGVLVLNSDFSKIIGLDKTKSKTDWNLLSLQMLSVPVKSHVQSVVETVIDANVNLAREWDRAAGATVSNDMAKILLFEAWTWALQGALFGSEAMKKYIKSNSYKLTEAEAELLLLRRGIRFQRDLMSWLFE
jgi:hypothetical protein